MPLTDFQKGVARVIAANRSPENHIGGGAVINRGETGLRTSDDLDIFHDALGGGRNAGAIVAASATTDQQSLITAGYFVQWVIRGDGFFRAIVSRDNEHVRLDWVADTAYRFFPVQEDAEFGYCLHRADLATNKVLALVGRSEVRDFLDILQLDQEYLSLGSIIWAACGKDEGYTPSLILDMTNRHANYQENDLRSENLVRKVDLKVLKHQWISARKRAEALCYPITSRGNWLPIPRQEPQPRDARPS